MDQRVHFITPPSSWTPKPSASPSYGPLEPEPLSYPAGDDGLGLALDGRGPGSAPQREAGWSRNLFTLAVASAEALEGDGGWTARARGGDDGGFAYPFIHIEPPLDPVESNERWGTGAEVHAPDASSSFGWPSGRSARSSSSPARASPGSLVNAISEPSTPSSMQASQMPSPDPSTTNTTSNSNTTPFLVMPVTIAPPPSAPTLPSYPHASQNIYTRSIAEPSPQAPQDVPIDPMLSAYGRSRGGSANSSKPLPPQHQPSNPASSVYAPPPPAFSDEPDPRYTQYSEWPGSSQPASSSSTANTSTQHASRTPLFPEASDISQDLSYSTNSAPLRFARFTEQPDRQLPPLATGETPPGRTPASPTEASGQAGTSTAAAAAAAAAAATAYARTVGHGIFSFAPLSNQRRGGGGAEEDSPEEHKVPLPDLQDWGTSSGFPSPAQEPSAPAPPAPTARQSAKRPRSPPPGPSEPLPPDDGGSNGHVPVAQNSPSTSAAADDTGSDGGQAKAPKRQPIACFHCRRRRLKCDGMQPCEPCARRGLVNTCDFAPNVRRRGPGKKKLAQLAAAGDVQAAEALGIEPGKLIEVVPKKRRKTAKNTA